MPRTDPRPPTRGAPALEAVYTIPEAADVLRQSRNSVYKLCRLGRLPGAYKIGTGGRSSSWRIPQGAITAYLANA